MKYLTKAEAETLSGIKLDGRKRYFMWNNDVCFNEHYTAPCSGCSYQGGCGSGSIGAGCHECGFTGKRKNSYPVPVRMSR